MDTQWFLTRNGETIAQYSTEQFKSAVSRRVLRPTDYVRRSDSSTLISASEFLPATYQPRSGVPVMLGRIAAVVAVLAGVGYGVGSFGPANLHTAYQNLEKLQTAVDRPSGIQETAMEQILLSDSASGGFLQALKKKDPAAFDALVSEFAGHAGTQAPEEFLPKVRAYLTNTIIKPRARNLGDDDKAAMLALDRDMSLQLAETNPKMCLAHALGQPAGDPKPFVTPELKSREDQLMLKLLDAEPQTFDVLPAKDVQAINTKVGTSLYQKHGDEVGLLDLRNAPAGKEGAACRMFAAYLDGVLTLPEPERVALVRAVMLAPERLMETETQDQTVTTAGDAPAPPAITQDAPVPPAEAADAAPLDADAAASGDATPPVGDAKTAAPEDDIPFPTGAQQRPR